MRWFRLYTEMLDDEKVQMLTPELFRTWINLLCVAASKGGVLPTVDKLAFKLRVSPTDMQNRIEDLVLAGLIDVRPDKTFEPHNWQQRQWKSDDSADRVRKHRHAKKECNDDVTVTVTPPDYRLQTTETDNLVSSSFEKPREEEKKSDLKFLGKGRRGLSPRLRSKAEGLGLDVDALERQSTSAEIEVPDAKFRSLVVRAVRERCPCATEDLIRTALTKDNDAAYATLCQMLLEVA